MNATTAPSPYPARLSVDVPGELDRLSTLLRAFWIIPIAIVLALVSGGFGGNETIREGGERFRNTGMSIGASIGIATGLMILFRQRYPRWWFDFQLALARFSTRVVSYAFLLSDAYPSTEDEQAIHLDIDYPDATRLDRWLPLVKWLLAIPHYVVLVALALGLIVVVVIAWIAIVVSGRYPRGLFDYVVGFERWALRVWAYAFLLVTDRYPPFSMA